MSSVAPQARAAVPSVGDCFRSFYRSETVLPKVNLERVLRGARRVDEAAKAAQALIQQQVARQGLSKCSSAKEFGPQARNEMGIQAGGKLPFDNAESSPFLENLPLHETTSYTAFDRLLRIPLQKRMVEMGQSLGIIVPALDPVPYESQEALIIGNAVDETYFALLEKVTCLDEQDTIGTFQGLSIESQRPFATPLCRFILECGIADATFTHIRLQKDENDENNALHHLVFFPPFPYQLLVAQEDPDIDLQPLSIEQCGRIGLARFAREAEKNNLPEMARIARKVRDNSLRTYSITRIVLSVLCPLIPLVLLVISAVQAWQLQRKIDYICNQVEWSEDQVEPVQLRSYLFYAMKLTHHIPHF